MTSKNFRDNFRVGVVALVLICGASMWLSRSTAQDAEKPAASSMLVESARAAYEGYHTLYELGHAKPEDVYCWSRRWMEAELKADSTNRSAVEDHKRRMTELHARVETLHRIGAAGGEETSLNATVYYLAEVESLNKE